MGVAGTARAGLGEGIESLQRDRLALHGAVDAVTSLQAYDVHETAMADGTRVREFVARNGAVFGVAWNGRSKPDLSVLLASHVAEYRHAAAANHFNHKILSVNSEGFVLQVIRLPRETAGSAYLPALLPAGATGAEVR
jgi:hypothetical protein